MKASFKLFLQKHAQFLSAGGTASRPPCLRRLETFPPDPQPPAAGSFALRYPMAPVAGGSAPRPPKSHTPLQISGYAPGKINICVHKITLTNFRDHGVRNLRMQL